VVALVAVLVAGGAVGVVLLSGDGERARTGTLPAPTRPVTTSSPSPSAGGPVSRAEADAVVNRYIQAYEGENLVALGALFADDIVQRSSTGAENRGKQAVLADFRLQFQVISDPQYTFTPSSFAEEPAPSRLSGTYDVETSIGGPSGEIEFGIAKVDGIPLIKEIVTRPG
jgi:hypothetical protein